MGEQVLVRFEGGPDDGATRVAELGDGLLTWPLPDVIHEPGRHGFYRKTMESQLDEVPRDVPLMRGAHYQWVQDE